MPESRGAGHARNSIRRIFPIHYRPFPISPQPFTGLIAPFGAIVLYSFVRSNGDIAMSAVITYAVLLGGAFTVALGLYFGFKAAKLI